MNSDKATPILEAIEVALLEPDNWPLQDPPAKKEVKKAGLAETAGSDSNMSIVVARNVEELFERRNDWQDLVEQSIEPNCFYEPWLLMPALESLAANLDLHFVLIYTTDRLQPLGPKILCGFFPLELSRRYKKMPVSVMRFWKHDYSFLCTPLLRAGCERETLARFFDWLESSASPAPLMECKALAADGAFHQLLIDELGKRAWLSLVEERYNRALFKPFMGEGISGRHKKELRRQQNRLAEEGLLEYAALETEAEVERWISDFLELEASGWKGQQESAFASQEASRIFFEKAIKGAFKQQQLMMIALKLNGRPIAMKCNFLTGGGAFAFKIAFDEDYSRFSPGVLLELENMRRVRANRQLEWMDSCAVSQHFMINRLWTGRRTIETILISTGKRPADLLVSVLPILRWFKRRLSRQTGKQ